MGSLSAQRRKRSIPPYGPAKGMIQALLLLQRITPGEVNEDFLKTNKIAPRNEYKVIGALRFLGLIDEEGKPSGKCQLLKTRGPTYTLALQEIVRTAYADLFHQLPRKEADREQIYNYFVTQESLGAEMAIKATRFFVDLCRMAEIELAIEPRAQRASGAKPQGTAKTTTRKGLEMTRMPARLPLEVPTVVSSPFPLVLAVTPEMADMEEERLVRLFRKMRVAWQKASEE